MQLWNAMTGAHIATLTGHSDEILDVCFDYAGQRIATASADGKWSDLDYCKDSNICIKASSSISFVSVLNSAWSKWSIISWNYRLSYICCIIESFALNFGSFPQWKFLYFSYFIHL